jgi:cytochrome c556
MRFSLKLTMLAIAALGVALLGTAQAMDDDIKDIKGCMAFTKTKVAKDDLPAQLKAASPDWAAIQKDTKQWVGVAEVLGKQTPPRGSAESWKKQTEKYLENVKAVDDAAQKKDAPATTKAIAMIQMSCGSCHSQHRPQKKK